MLSLARGAVESVATPTLDALGASPMVQGARAIHDVVTNPDSQDAAATAQRAMDYGRRRLYESHWSGTSDMENGDSHSRDGALSGTMGGVRLGRGDGVSVARGDDGGFTVSGTTEGSVGLSASSQGVGGGGTLSGSTTEEYSFETPGEARNAAAILEQQHDHQRAQDLLGGMPVIGGASNLLFPDISDEQRALLADHHSATEIQGEAAAAVAATASGDVGGTAGSGTVGGTGSASAGRASSVRIEYPEDGVGARTLRVRDDSTVSLGGRAGGSVTGGDGSSVGASTPGDGASRRVRHERAFKLGDGNVLDPETVRSAQEISESISIRDRGGNGPIDAAGRPQYDPTRPREDHEVVYSRNGGGLLVDTDAQTANARGLVMGPNGTLPGLAEDASVTETRSQTRVAGPRVRLDASHDGFGGRVEASDRTEHPLSSQTEAPETVAERRLRQSG